MPTFAEFSVRTQEATTCVHFPIRLGEHRYHELRDDRYRYYLLQLCAICRLGDRKRDTPDINAQGNDRPQRWSTDNSSEVIIRYADRVSVIEQPNLGSIAAYNHGFKGSSGEAVVFLDADDLLEQDARDGIASVWYCECAKVQSLFGMQYWAEKR